MPPQTRQIHLDSTDTWQSWQWGDGDKEASLFWINKREIDDRCEQFMLESIQTSENLSRMPLFFLEGVQSRGSRFCWVNRSWILKDFLEKKNKTENDKQ